MSAKRRIKHTATAKASLDLAYARGVESLTTGARNPYRHGTYCWLEFNRGRLAARPAQTTNQ